jgi:tRNA(Ile)-lysidine synthase
MLTLETFKQYWDKAFPDVRLRSSHFILAVSGGVDSVVLTHLMHSVSAKCTIAHVNFQLRGVESNRDEQFVRDYAKQLNMPLQVNIFDTANYAATNKMGIQQAAREIRYTWFEELIAQINKEEMERGTREGSAKLKPVVLLTAHHANDQVETILMQLFRGTGLHGLTGIPERRIDKLNIARPLLIFSKEEIKAYAELNDLRFVEDSSNEKNDYTRNLIRNKLLPELQIVFPMVNDNILSTSQRLKEAEGIVNYSVASFWKKGLKIKKGIPSIAIDYWNKINGNATYTWGIIKHYGFKSQQIEEVHKILNASKGAYIQSATHKLINWNGYIQIVNSSSQKELLTIPQGTNMIAVGNGKLKFEWIDNKLNIDFNKDPNFKDPHYAFMDASKLEWPLLFRTWEPTDYFYPFGLRKKKKLNHFLGGLKLSPSLKSKTAVLCSSDHIFWIVGKRIDDRFKIAPSTQQVLKISFEESL